MKPLQKQEILSEDYLSLLYQACADIYAPYEGMGRHPIGLSDIAICLVVKESLGESGRGVSCYLGRLQDDGYIGAIPHHNSFYNYLKSETVTHLLQTLAEDLDRVLGEQTLHYNSLPTVQRNQMLCRKIGKKIQIIKEKKIELLFPQSWEEFREDYEDLKATFCAIKS